MQSPASPAYLPALSEGFCPVCPSTPLKPPLPGASRGEAGYCTTCGGWWYSGPLNGVLQGWSFHSAEHLSS